MGMHIWIDARSLHAFEKIYSITLLERLLRQLFTLGVRQHVTVVLPPQLSLDRWLRHDFRPRFSLEYATVYSEAPLGTLVHADKDVEHSLMVLEGDGIYDERVLKTLLTSPHSLAIYGRNHEETPVAVVIHASDRKFLTDHPLHLQQLFQQDTPPGWLKTLSIDEMDSYIPELRQTAVPMLRKLRHKRCIRAIENAMYENTFKGVMDFIATFIYRLPVRELTRWLAPTRVTPNQITAVSVFCSFAAIPLFAMGWLWTGLAVAFTFIIADSVDGKLARLTIRLSKVAGHVDHVTSPLFEACYYLAWGWYFSAGTFSTLPGQAGVLLSCFYVLDKITTSVFGLTFRRSLLDYQPWDARFHLIAARRTINLFIMTLGCLFQMPVVALYVITLWMFVTLLWHLSRFALHAYRRSIAAKTPASIA
jgi:phosphatidylglycerophosphate synthase